MHDVVRQGLGKRVREQNLKNLQNQGILNRVEDEDFGLKKGDKFWGDKHLSVREKLGISKKKLKIEGQDLSDNSVTKSHTQPDLHQASKISDNLQDAKNQQKWKYFPESQTAAQNTNHGYFSNTNFEDDTLSLTQAFIDLKKVKSLGDLLLYPLDDLKSELKRLGLKTGGSLEIVAERLWSIKMDPSNLLNPKLIQKS